MKLMSVIYLLVALLLVGVCFVPWVYIETINATVTGVNGAVVNFGRPGIMNIFFTTLSVAMFLLPSVWAKRINLFVCAFNLSWSFRNYLILTQCEMGECPQKRWGIFVLLILSLSLMLLSFFPPFKFAPTNLSPAKQ